MWCAGGMCAVKWAGTGAGGAGRGLLGAGGGVGGVSTILFAPLKGNREQIFRVSVSKTTRQVSGERVSRDA